MPDPPVSLQQFPSQASERMPPFVCSTADGYVYVAGEVDLATSPQLERALEAELSRSRAVVLEGRRLVLLHGPHNADRLFRLTGTADQVTFFESPIPNSVT